MRKIKVAFFITNLGQGGAERQLIELLKGLDKEMFEVFLYLYAYQKDSFYQEIFNLNGINVITNKLKRTNKPLKIIEALLYIRNVLRNDKFDLIFSTLFMNNLFVRIIAPSSFKNKIIANSRNSIKLYTKYHLFVEQLLIKKSYLVFNSKDALFDFQKVFNAKYHSKLFTIYNGFDIIEYSNKDEKKLDTIIIGGLGRQSKQKNFKQLVYVFKYSINKHLSNRPIKLMLQGSKGDETEEIKELTGNDNSIEIIEPSPDINDFFNKIDIMVLPSHFEGCPNVLFESMIHKTICVISKGANSDDFVIDGINGFVYDGTDEGLKETLLKAIKVVGTEKEKQITERAFRYVKENFSMEAMVKNYEQLFLDIYEKNKSSN